MLDRVSEACAARDAGLLALALTVADALERGSFAAAGLSRAATWLRAYTDSSRDEARRAASIGRLLACHPGTREAVESGAVTIGRAGVIAAVVTDPRRAAYREHEAVVLEGVARVHRVEDAEALLSRNAVGRLAYMLRNQVEIVPIHYVYEDGWIYARSAIGQKLVALMQSPWVAFEVDEVEGVDSWRSVVVRGSAQVLDPDGPPMEREALEQAIAALRRASPQVLRSGDPSPGRNFIVRIHVDRVTGKVASPAG